MTPLRNFIAALFVAALPGLAFADSTGIPEPETLSLIAIGAIALIVARRRRN